MSGLISALQFLTAIPIKIKRERLAGAPVWFPIVGLFLGLILVGLNRISGVLNFDNFSIAVFLVVSSALLTGGLHLDGLADTTDALASRKSKDDMLAIMRDSHIGAMGVVAIVCVLLLKVALLSSTPAKLMNASLLVMMVLSRWSMIFAMFLFPYARDEGKAKILVGSTNIRIFIVAGIIALASVGAALKLKGLFLFIGVSLSTYLFSKYISKKLSGITGDTLGATNELAEVITLFLIGGMGNG